MKKLLLGLSLCLLASSAFAADAIVEEVAPAFSWTGGYAGIQAGYAWGDGDIDQITGPGFIDTSPDGFLGGIYAGYNYQMSNNIVIGAELDVVVCECRRQRPNIHRSWGPLRGYLRKRRTQLECGG